MNVRIYIYINISKESKKNSERKIFQRCRKRGKSHIQYRKIQPLCEETRVGEEWEGRGKEITRDEILGRNADIQEAHREKHA